MVEVAVTAVRQIRHIKFNLMISGPKLIQIKLKRHVQKAYCVYFMMVKLDLQNKLQKDSDITVSIERSQFASRTLKIHKIFYTTRKNKKSMSKERSLSLVSRKNTS